MQTQKLGQTELYITNVGLGTWAIGGTGWQFSWGKQDDRESIATIQQALELGINWIDTAPVYGLGHAEEIVGKAIKGLSAKPIIATKCGRFGDENGNVYSRIKKESIRSEVEASLKRLQVEVIDLYQIHWPKPENDIEEAWETVTELIAAGKIRYAGVSNFNVNQLERLRTIRPVDSLQPPYSILERGIEAELLQYCLKNNIGVIVYSPLQKGLLSGKFSKERVKKLSVDDHRREDFHFHEPLLSAAFELVEGLKTIAQKYDRSPAQLAIAWVLRRSEVTAAIVGARHPTQIQEPIPAGDWKLADEDITAIDRLSSEFEKIRKQGENRH